MTRNNGECNDEECCPRSGGSDDEPELCAIHKKPVGECECKFIGSLDEKKPIRHLGDLSEAEREEFQKDTLALANKYNLAFCVYGQKIVDGKVVGHSSVGQGYLCEYIASCVDIANRVNNAMQDLFDKTVPPEKKN